MKKPPQQAELFDSVLPCAQVLFGELSESAVSQCGRLVSVVDDKGRYLHWDDLLKKTNQQQKAKAQWSLIKLARNAVLKTVPRWGKP